MRINLSTNLSYCFGVRKTLTLVEDLISRNSGRAYYMYGEIVHNEMVVSSLRRKGLRIIRSLEEIGPWGSVVIPSHGAPLYVFEELRARGIDVIDATCPMVQLIQAKAQALEAKSYIPVVIGDPNHDEVKGIVGHVGRAIVVRTPADVAPGVFGGVARAGVVVQSTFIRAEAIAIVDALKARVPEVLFEDTICRPTTERQDEVRRMADIFDVILVIGSRTSANTRHLFDLASGRKARAYLISDPDQAADLSLAPESSVFIASGASTPLSAVERVVELLERRGGLRPEGGQRG